MTEQVKTAEEVLVEIRAAFDAAHEAGKEGDAIKLDMISAGATFKNVTRLFNEFMVDAGHVASKDERDQLVIASIQGKDLSSEEGFASAVAALVETLKGATEKSAAALIRALAKKEGIECFKKAKESTGEGRPGFATGYYDWLAANPSCTKEEATAFVMGTDGHAETSENVKRHLSHYLNLATLANRIAEARAQ